MTLQEAYTKAKNNAKRDGHTMLVSCSDYGDSWGFFFKPPTEEEVDGLGDITVNKRTGAIGFFIPTMDFDKYDSSVDIPIEQFKS